LLWKNWWFQFQIFFVIISWHLSSQNLNLIHSHSMSEMTAKGIYYIVLPWSRAVKNH
jgi:hypothetical protein